MMTWKWNQYNHTCYSKTALPLSLPAFLFERRRRTVVLFLLSTKVLSFANICPTKSHPDVFETGANFLWTRFVLVELDFCCWMRKLKSICACFSGQNSSGFSSAKALERVIPTCGVQQWPLIHSWLFVSTRIWLSSTGFDVLEMSTKT